MTSHKISRLLTLPLRTSLHNRPHYFISLCNQPHDIIPHHTTTHYITWNTNRPPPEEHHHQTERLKAGAPHNNLLWACHCLAAVRAFHRQSLPLAFSCFRPWNFRARVLLVFPISDDRTHCRIRWAVSEALRHEEYRNLGFDANLQSA